MDSPLHSDAEQFDLPACPLPLADFSAISPAFFTRLGEQSRLRHIIIGFPEDVNQEILNLYRCGYDVDAWSPPQRILGSAEVITVCIKRTRRVE